MKIFWLILDIPNGGHYCAVVIEDTWREALNRACLMDKHRRKWMRAAISKQAQVAASRTPQVLAMDGV